MTMQPPLVIKQGTSTGQISMQPSVMAVPMSGNSTMPASISNVVTLNKSGQNVVVTNQNLNAVQSGALGIPNVQILSMRPGAPAAVSSQKTVGTVPPRVVIGTQQVVGARATTPGIALQTLQTLQPGQQGHLLLKTENGQYQLLRVGPAPAAATLTVPQTQTIRLSTVPAHAGVATVSTSVPEDNPMAGHLPAAPVATPIVASITTQKPTENTKEKCRNFLANLLDLSSKEPKSVEISVRTLIQELIDVQVEPEEFCNRLEKLLNASPQPCLIGFLKKSLPLLRHSMVIGELTIEGIKAPASPVMYAPFPTVSQNVPGNQYLQKPAPKPGKTISVLQNIPVQTKMNIGKMINKSSASTSKNFVRPGSSASVLATPIKGHKTLLKEKEKKTNFLPLLLSDDKLVGDDDINDVAAMGGVNLAEESQKILGSTDAIGSQIRSCKDEYAVPLSVMQAKLKVVSAKYDLGEPSPEVAGLLCHAVHERLKNIVEKLAVIAKHRIDVMYNQDSRYEVTQNVKAQLQFLQELDSIQQRRREKAEREMLLRAARSRSKSDNPELASLKAKGKEVQRAEQIEASHRETNQTALQALGSRKRTHVEASGDQAVASTSGSSGPRGSSSRYKLVPRNKVSRITQRDVIFLMEQDRDTTHSVILFKSYLK